MHLRLQLSTSGLWSASSSVSIVRKTKDFAICLGLVAEQKRMYNSNKEAIFTGIVTTAMVQRHPIPTSEFKAQQNGPTEGSEEGGRSQGFRRGWASASSDGVSCCDSSVRDRSARRSRARGATRGHRGPIEVQALQRHSRLLHRPAG